MKILNAEEVAAVSGGILPLLGVLGFVYYERNNIGDFFSGFYDGLGGLSAQEL